ncbi:L domain-like protein [Rhizoclosmatium globosum]|uniref:L domain-like protein n=1 Tax=Rhizoclosmatium globosum TaxID=329046 RepID=A0A1Y2CG03_9FUNG|nr:L domain-like protein [Rhizoclosmatium globosum]|eukprot:ORY45993.1 L domain-like protein [Rhizoclosmatium globosum]
MNSNTLPTLPTELIFSIFSWLSPIEALKLRTLCKRIQTCLKTSHFALLVTARFLHGTDTDFLISNKSFDQLFFKFPEPYSRLAAEHLCVVMARHSYIQLRWDDLTLANVALPPAVKYLTYFWYLQISKTELTGCLPVELFGLVKLKVLDLSDNKITGPLPNEVGQLVNLECLCLRRNQMNGPIPESIGELKQLVQLVLNDNEFTTLPQSIGELSKLEALHLSCNNIGGRLPSTLGRLQSLVFLLLNNNLFEGEIPVEIARLESLRFGDFSSNKLSGLIPNEFVDLIQLEALDLRGNSLWRDPTLTNVDIDWRHVLL